MKKSELEKYGLPENAKCVFKGVLFDTYQWEQELFDGTTTTFEKVVRLGSTQIICITPEKKIILFNEEQPGREKYISLAGGQIEKNETYVEGAKRELLEEIGSECSELELFKEVIPNHKIHWPTFYLIAKNCTKVQEPKLDAGERIEPFEVDFDEFIEISQKEEFQNKFFSEIIFKIIHTSGELEKFKKMLFD